MANLAPIVVNNGTTDVTLAPAGFGSNGEAMFRFAPQGIARQATRLTQSISRKGSMNETITRLSVPTIKLDAQGQEIVTSRREYELKSSSADEVSDAERAADIATLVSAITGGAQGFIVSLDRWY